MLLDIGTAEIAHVEMLSIMIARLLEGAPVPAQEDAVAQSPGVAAAMGGTNMTDDAGVRDMLSFNIARDYMHQNQWAAAIEQLRLDGLEAFRVPGTFPQDRVLQSQAHTFYNLSAGTESSEGRWAHGPMPDGLAEFEYIADMRPLSNDPGLAPPGQSAPARNCQGAATTGFLGSEPTCGWPWWSDG